MQSITKQFRVTGEQIDACQRFTCEATDEVFYIVRSASRPDREYKVTWNKQYQVVQCDPRCEASQNGQNCWHRRAVMASESLYRQQKRDEAEARQRRLIEEEANRQAEYQALLAARPYRPSEKAVLRDMQRCQPQGFSLLR
jgi:hypothetical protein